MKIYTKWKEIKQNQKNNRKIHYISKKKLIIIMSNTNNSEDKELNHPIADKKFLKFKRKKILSSKKIKKREGRNSSQNQTESSRYIEIDQDDKSGYESGTQKKEGSPRITSTQGLISEQGNFFPKIKISNIDYIYYI